MKKYHSILIPANASPHCIEISGGEKFDLDLRKVLSAETTCGCSIDFTDKAGYALAMFADDIGHAKKLPYNSLGSLIAGRKGPIPGDCVLVDDYKKLTLDDLSKIVDMAKGI